MRRERVVLSDGEHTSRSGSGPGVLRSVEVGQRLDGLAVEHRDAVAAREEVGDVDVRVRREERDVAASELAPAVVERGALVGVQGVPVPEGQICPIAPTPGHRRRRRAAGASASAAKAARAGTRKVAGGM